MNPKKVVALLSALLCATLSAQAYYDYCIVVPFDYECPWNPDLSYSGSTQYCFYSSGIQSTVQPTEEGSLEYRKPNFKKKNTRNFQLRPFSTGCVPPSEPDPCPPLDVDDESDECEEEEEEENCDAPTDESSENVGSEVDLWGLKYYDSYSDIKLAVPSGWLSVNRRYANGSWRMDGTETIIAMPKDATGYARVSLSGKIFTKTSIKSPGFGPENDSFGTFVSDDGYILQYKFRGCVDGQNIADCAWTMNNMVVMKPDGSWLHFIGDPNRGGLLRATGHKDETHLIFERDIDWSTVTIVPQGQEYPIKRVLSGMEKDENDQFKVLVYYNYGADYAYNNQTWHMLESVTTYDISSVTAPDPEYGQIGVLYQYYLGIGGEPGTGLLKSVTKPDGTRSVYTYDEDRNLATKTEYAQDGVTVIKTATIDYQTTQLTQSDAVSGKLLVGAIGGPPKPVAAVTDGAGITKRFSGRYNETTGGYYSKVTYSNGSIKEVWFDDEHEVIQTSLDGQVVRNVARVGRVERVTTDGNSVTIQEYDEFDNLIRETLQTGHVRSWTYETFFNSLSTNMDELIIDDSVESIDPAESSDLFNVETTRLVTMTDEYGTEMRYTYADDDWGTDANGVSYNSLPYQATRSVKIDQNGGELSRTRWEYYDSLDRLVLEIDWRGHQTAYAYKDMTNLIIQAWRPDVINQETGQPFVNYIQTFDDLGFLESYTDAAGNVTYYNFSATGKLLRETDPHGISTIYTYEGDNIVERETGRIGDPGDANYKRGRIMRFTYDGEGRVLSEIRVDNDGVEYLYHSYKYDTMGHLVSKTDADGLTITYEYDDWGNRTVTQVPLPAARAADITEEFAIDRAEWNVHGDLKKQTNAAGLITTYTYDKMGRVLIATEGVETDDERSVSYRYDAMGNIIETTHGTREGTFGVTKNTFDAFERMTSRSGYGVYNENYTYDSNDNLLTVTNARGLVTTYTYDEFDRVYQVYEDNVLIDTRYYDLNGNLIEQIDAEDIHTYWAYDSLNRLAFESTPGDSKPEMWWGDFENVQVQNEYNRFGQIETVRTAHNEITTTIYDDFGRQKMVTIPAGATMHYEYTAADRPRRIIYPVVSTSGQGLQSEMVYNYDTINPSLQTSVQQRSGEIVYNYYDEALQLARVDQSTGSIQIIAYDDFGRIISERDYASVLDYNAGTVYRTTQYTDYDDFDRLLEITLPGEKGTQTMVYDDKGKLLQRSGSQVFPVIYSYDDVGNLKTMQTYYGANDTAAATLSTTEWVYDLRNRLKQKIYPDGNSTDYTYYDNDRLHTRTNARNQITTYTYDAWGNIDLVDYPAGQTDVDFDYIKGRLDSMTDAAGTSTWTYHPNSGLPASEIRANFGTVPTTVSWEYDNEGRRFQLTVNGIPGELQPWQTVYNYDRYGRLELLQDSRAHPTDAFTYAYHPTNSLLEYIYSPWKQSGAEGYLGEQRDYDSFGRLKFRQLNASSQTSIMGANNLQYNDIDQLTNADLFGGVLYAGQQSRVFDYDSYGQLKEQTNGNEIVQHFEFDAMGNRLNWWQGDPSDPATALDTYVPNDLNQYDSFSQHNAGITVPVYDEDGNLEQQVDWTYIWDAENRLVAAENPGVKRVDFLYDGEGRRMSKTVLDWDATGNNWLSAERYMFVYDGWNLVAELKLEGSSYQVEASYTWGLDISGTMQGDGGVGGLLAVVQSDNSPFLAAYDFNSNIIGYVDTTNETIVAEYEYGPFGELIRTNGEKKDTFNFKFSTKYEDTETGLVYYGYRHYNADTGRWLNRDPIEENGGLNLYAFVWNNPINSIDLYGLNIYLMYEPLGAGHVGVAVDGPNGRIYTFHGGWYGGTRLSKDSYGSANIQDAFRSKDEYALMIPTDSSTDEKILEFLYNYESREIGYCSTIVANSLKAGDINAGIGLLPAGLVNKAEKRYPDSVRIYNTHYKRPPEEPTRPWRNEASENFGSIPTWGQ